MTRKKPITKIIASVLSVVMVFGVLMFVSPTEAQAISLNATDTGFYNLAYGANGDTTFGAGAQIRVINHTRTDKNKSDAVYKYDDMNWEPVGNDYVVWEGMTNNTFYGVYPYNADYDKFTIPTDQSDGVEAADWMTAAFTNKKSVGKVDFTFQHRLAKVTVNITKWNNEFTGTEEIAEPKIYTKGTAVEVSYGTGTDGADKYTSDGMHTAITPSATGQTYTAIVAPLKYDANDKFMTFTVDGQDMTVFARNGTLAGGLQPGNHYTFDLTVGKDAVEITEVKVTDWKEQDIDGGVAKECPHDATINNGACAVCGKQVYVDLGLSVNWATVNIGATKPEEAGDFFAWGETEPKDTYDWSTYKWCNGSDNSMTKYCTSSSYGYNGFTDNITELELADDAAVQNWGKGWMMPTQEQLAELLDDNNCTWTWTTVNGVEGYQITSKVPGYEGNSIFLPFALYKDDISQQSQNRAAYWTRTLYKQEHFGYVLGFNSYNYDQRGYSRAYGCLIRPVLEK